MLNRSWRRPLVVAGGLACVLLLTVAPGWAVPQRYLEVETNVQGEAHIPRIRAGWPLTDDIQLEGSYLQHQGYHQYRVRGKATLLRLEGNIRRGDGEGIPIQPRAGLLVDLAKNSLPAYQGNTVRGGVWIEADLGWRLTLEGTLDVVWYPGRSAFPGTTLGAEFYLTPLWYIGGRADIPLMDNVYPTYTVFTGIGF